MLFSSLCFTRTHLRPLIRKLSGFSYIPSFVQLKPKMDEMKELHVQISNELSTSTQHSKKIIDLSKQLSELDDALIIIDKLERIQRDRDSAKQLIDPTQEKYDKEVGQMAYDEILELDTQEKQMMEGFLTNSCLIPVDPDDHSDVIVELRAGVGGDESGYFCSELVQMYKNYASLMKWDLEILYEDKAELEGIREAGLSIKGTEAFGQLKYEGGIHRVQRVPINDVRIQTSVVSVVVMSQPDGSDSSISSVLNPKDLRIDFFRSSGPGGQHVNKTESAVRITHLPTGITAEIQDERSQHQNKEKAMKVVTARVLNKRNQEMRENLTAIRSKLIGSGERSDRIRTYNYPQDRVTEHRVHVSVSGVSTVLSGGGLSTIIDSLRNKDMQDKIENLLLSIKRT